MIFILDGPKFTTPAEHVAVDLGEAANLQCSVDANPSPAIVWYRKNDHTKILSSSNVYHIRTVGDSHIGVYTCYVTVDGFESIGMDIHLIKKGIRSTCLSQYPNK